MKLQIDNELESKLQYIKFKETKNKIATFPDFLIVGPQRTGTTWLAHNLRVHPQIFFSYPKELYFFNSLIKNKKHHLLIEVNCKILKDSPINFFKRLLMNLYRRSKIKKFKYNEINWYLNFFKDTFLEYLLKLSIMLIKYQKLYRPKVRGEGTASNSHLGEEIIKEIVTLNPNIKVVLMVRDPIERAWSHAKKNLIRGKNRAFEDVKEEEFISFFLEKGQIERASYLKNIKTWKKYIRRGNLFIGFFEDIQSNPQNLLINLFDFLEIEADPKYLTKKINIVFSKGGSQEIPEKLLKELEKIYPAYQYSQLKDNIKGNYVLRSNL